MRIASIASRAEAALAVFFFAALIRAQQPLQLGDLLPSLSGKTLSDKTLALPSAASGKPSMIVFSFTRAAGNDARLWNEHFLKDFRPTAASYFVIELESAPRLVRGMAISGIRSSVLPEMRDRSIVLIQDEKLWKARLAVSGPNRAYVVVLGPDSRIRWTNSAAFSDAAYAQLKQAFASVP